MLDFDLARVYGVETKALNRAAKRNADRFPKDFMFQISSREWENLRCQFGTLKTGRGQHRKYLPYAFTEHGAIMAANVLNSARAVQMSVFVVRAFVKLREALGAHKELADKLTELERRVGTHDKAIVSIIAAIRGLTESPKHKPRAIGFRAKRESKDSGGPKQIARRARKK